MLPSVVSQFTKVPVGEYMLRFGIVAPPTSSPLSRTPSTRSSRPCRRRADRGQLEKVTRTWLNEQDARIKTNDYWSEHLRDRALDPDLDDEGPAYVTRVNALTAADVQAAALYADPANRVRLALRQGRGRRE